MGDDAIDYEYGDTLHKFVGAGRLEKVANDGRVGACPCGGFGDMGLGGFTPPAKLPPTGLATIAGNSPGENGDASGACDLCVVGGLIANDQFAITNSQF